MAIELFELPEGVSLAPGQAFSVVSRTENRYAPTIRGFYVCSQTGSMLMAVEQWRRFGDRPWFDLRRDAAGVARLDECVVLP